jgi:hypothetical protein
VRCKLGDKRDSYDLVFHLINLAGVPLTSPMSPCALSAHDDTTHLSVVECLIKLASAAVFRELVDPAT